MEEKGRPANHKIILNGRKAAFITGVNDVLSFDPREVILETELGMLMIKGEELHVNRLTLEKGEVDVDGRVNSFLYSEKGATGEGKSFLKHLFQ